MSPRTYEQRPPVVQAIQFDGTNAGDLAAWLGTPAPAELNDDGSVTLGMPNAWMNYTFPTTFAVSDWLMKPTGSDFMRSTNGDFTSQFKLQA